MTYYLIEHTDDLELKVIELGTTLLEIMQAKEIAQRDYPDGQYTIALKLD